MSVVKRLQNVRFRFLLTLLSCVLLPGYAFAQLKAPTQQPNTRFERAVFAGGCFWSMESAFASVKGISKLVVGFAGGTKKNPSYEEVNAGKTGHLESLEITFDPQVVSFQKLLDVYWRNIDPTNPKGQFFDEGEEYRPAIFYYSAAQKMAAEQSKEIFSKSGRFSKPLVVQVITGSAFYAAEEYHQQYYLKNAEHYQRYRKGSGRDAFFKQIWGESHQRL